MTKIEAGAGALVLAPFGAELGLAGAGREEIALALAGARAFGCDRCRGWRGRFGAALRFHLAPRARLDPWAGLVAGGQLFSLPRLAGTSAPLLGLYHVLQVGLDVALSPGRRAGAFAAGALQAQGRPLDHEGRRPRLVARPEPPRAGRGAARRQPLLGRARRGRRSARARRGAGAGGARRAGAQARVRGLARR